MSETNSELKNIIEAALLVAGTPLTLEKLLGLFPEESRPARDDIRAAIEAIERDCEQRGIELKKLEHGYRFQTKPRYADWIARLSEERPVRYSRALLETLAIIAYRQPVTRGEIEDIRGVAVSSETIRTLLAREWVKELGKRDVPGKPSIYGTTKGFLEHFNLKALTELPPLAELRDLDRISEELNLKLPVQVDAGVAEAVDAAGAGALAPPADAADAGAESAGAT